ncbi:dihydrolipoyl dehydrogenase [Candidatus Aerophobetes bacterium]|nr:dihydrolipoyl dehydrogenase [Candidatus Aerophobetes bacterium]
MSNSKIIIIGAGPGGYVAGIRAAQLEADVTIIEENQIGGTCLNRGCIPTKSLLASTEALLLVRRASELGIEVGEAVPNFSRMMERKNRIVSGLRGGVDYLLKANKIKVIKGKAGFLDSHKIHIETDTGTQKLEGEKIIIASGSKPLLLPFIDFDHSAVLTSEEALKLKEIPKSLLIIGAGVIGCEFASIFNPLGTKITMVEMMDQILPTEDKRIVQVMQQVLQKRGINIFTKTKLEEIIEYREDSITARFDNGEEVTTEKILISVGREANTEGLGLENLLLRVDGKGNIIVNEKMETNLEGIYAIGDVVGGYLLAHVAFEEGIVAAENALGIDSKIDYTSVPNCIFTSPQIGTVGLTLDKAKEEIEAKLARFPFAASGKAQAMGEAEGLLQLIVEEDSGRILGGQIIGPHAADLIHEIALAVRWGLTTEQVASTIHAHPTFSEAIMEVAKKAEGKPIHLT